MILRARRLKVSQRQIGYRERLVLELSTPGDVPEKTIESELLKVVARHNPAFDPRTEGLRPLAQSRLRELHAQGAELFKSSGEYDADTDTIARLGGMYVPPEMKDEVFEELQNLGYELDESN